ncbi:MAG TPA: hypothetical protein P5205_03060 [Candidatus Paceibacterota bacterium]|nr:hypothetical protein [Verrucomicrobiota bacterium]HSA09328.1 hypothetical protein [Candidatus Paceibacterota bacterium]
MRKNKKRATETSKSAKLTHQALQFLREALKLLQSQNTTLPPGSVLLDPESSGDFATVDKVEIRGQLGTTEQRALKINGKPPLSLNLREHLVLLILGWLAKCSAKAAASGKGQFPDYLPVGVIVKVILTLTAEGGPVSGRWRVPCELDVYRCVAKLRRRLRELGFSPNLIESGQRLAGYRLSTHVNNIILAVATEQQEKFWANLFQDVLGGGGVSREEAPFRG